MSSSSDQKGKAKISEGVESGSGEAAIFRTRPMEIEISNTAGPEPGSSREDNSSSDSEGGEKEVGVRESINPEATEDASNNNNTEATGDGDLSLRKNEQYRYAINKKVLGIIYNREEPSVSARLNQTEERASQIASCYDETDREMLEE